MQDRWYLLSLKEILEKEETQQREEELQAEETQQAEEKLQTEQDLKAEEILHIEEELQRAVLKLDEERARKLTNIKPGKKKIESIGAGLLLQLAVREALELLDVSQKLSKSEATEVCQRLPEREGCVFDKKNDCLPIFARLTLSQLLQKVQEPLPLAYTYGNHGKPYLKNYPFYFNLSHSGDYVLCVLSEQEIGADIQWKSPQVSERVLQRFFSAEEKAYWEQCSTENEKRDFFYQMWCRKEAYGKLTGEGIGDAVSVDMYSPALPIIIEEPFISDEYQIAVCKWKEI